MLVLRWSSLALCALVGNAIATSCTTCKCTPHDACWPSEAEFSRLNQSISGRLIRTVPPASVCYATQPNYDPKACQVVLSSWFDANFHYHDPTSIGSPIWAGNPCPPIYPNGTSVTGDPNAGSKGCSLGGYPAFAVNATEPSHVQKVVKFARKNNIRLNVKSTGHSFQGRSTAFGSLSVYTSNYRGIKFHKNFQPQNCHTPGTQMAATLGAGENMKSVYSELAKHNAIVVGGSAQTVGVVGWFTGGGHGPLSSEYGMGADNLLQVTMVTPEGKLVIANACQHSDLFWAVRGGGGGTFGVVLEAVMKAYPSPKTTYHSLTAQFIAPDELENWRIVAYVHSQMPLLKEGGLQGYYAVLPAIVAGALTLQLGFLAYDKPNGTTEQLFEPITHKFEEHPDKVRYFSSVSHFPNFYEAWTYYAGFEAVAESGMGFGSRLLDAKSLTQDVDYLAEAFRNVTVQRNEYSPVIMIGHMIANSKNTGLDISMNPGWRDTVTHLVLVDPFPDFVSKATREEVYNYMTHNRVPTLKKLSPSTGAYLNEADPFDPEFQRTFWGENYNRLRILKDKYDPDSVLWCISCVGSEGWSVREDGKLCRTSSPRKDLPVQ